MTRLESRCVDSLSRKSEGECRGELHGERMWSKVILGLQSVKRKPPEREMPLQLYLQSTSVTPPEMSLIVFTLPCCSY